MHTRAAVDRYPGVRRIYKHLDYNFVPCYKTWRDAKAHCANLGATLIWYADRDEMDFVGRNM
jgi:hypothetical protein